jgi:hypothetical protein
MLNNEETRCSSPNGFKTYRLEWLVRVVPVNSRNSTMIRTKPLIAQSTTGTKMPFCTTMNGAAVASRR